jgi:hypothetical protein
MEIKKEGSDFSRRALLALRQPLFPIIAYKGSENRTAGYFCWGWDRRLARRSRSLSFALIRSQFDSRSRAQERFSSLPRHVLASGREARAELTEQTSAAEAHQRIKQPAPRKDRSVAREGDVRG